MELQRSVAARSAAGGGAFHARGRRKFDAQTSTAATPQQSTGAEAQARAEGAQADAELPEWGEVRRLQAALDEAARCVSATAATATPPSPAPSPSPPTLSLTAALTLVVPTPNPHHSPSPLTTHHSPLNLHPLQACRRAGDGAARRASVLAAGASGRATTELATRNTRHIRNARPARPARHVRQRIDGLAEHAQLRAQRCVVHGRAGPEDGSAAALAWQAQVAAVREGLASAHVGGAQLAKARGTVACAGRVDRAGLTAALALGSVVARGDRHTRHDPARGDWFDAGEISSRECE